MDSFALPPTKKAINPWLLIAAVTIGCLVLLPVGAWFVSLFVSERLEPNDRRLPDGSILRLEKVTWGQTHEFQFEIQRRSWGLFWSRKQESLSFSRAGPDQLVVWMTCRSSRRGTPLNFDWWQSSHMLDQFGKEVSDYNANVFEIADDPKLKFVKRGGPSNTSSCDKWVALSCFPQHRVVDGRLQLRIRNTAGDLVAEFDLPHPVPIDPPLWSPEPLPVTKTDRDLTVTFEGVEIESVGAIDRNVQGVKEWWIRPKYKLQWHGPTPKNLIFTTKEIVNPLTTHGVPYREKCIDRDFHEPAWKFRFAVCEYPDELLNASDQAVIRGIAIPPANTAVSLSEKVTVNGVTIEVVAIAGPGSTSYFVPRTAPLQSDLKQGFGVYKSEVTAEYEMKMSDPSRMIAKSPFPHVLYRLSETNRKIRFDLSAHDERGDVLIPSTHLIDQEFRSLVFQPPPESKTVDLAVKVQIPREFEFVFQPPPLPE